jgi:hypothetical protein
MPVYVGTCPYCKKGVWFKNKVEAEEVSGMLAPLSLRKSLSP